MEEVNRGQYYCFQCAMFQTVSGVETTLKERKERAEAKKLEEKKKWGPFRYFVAASSVLILVMWGVILFGGQKPPAGISGLRDNERVLLFMVNSAVNRYAHYEGKTYPEKIQDLIPKYLSLGKNDLPLLEKVYYERVPREGYRLSLTKTKPGEINLTISPKGIEYKIPAREGGK